MLFLLGTRQHLALNVAKDRNPPYMLLSGGEVRNAYTLKLRNMEGRPRRIRVGLEGVPGAAMWTDDTSRSSAARSLTVAAAADQTTPLRVYVAAPAGTAPQPLEFELTALDREGGEASYHTRFDAPGGD
jgi:polyferredoxin